ncbi:MAG: hypothetical protein RSA17_05720, partial [Ruthenibacterium sp.]
GTLTLQVMDEKVYRILTAYEKARLLRSAGRAEETIEDVLTNPRCQNAQKTTAEKSVLVCRDEAKLLPLAQNAHALVIEQRVPRQFCPNNGHWYHGMLYDALCRFSNELSYIETGMQCSQIEHTMIFEHLNQFNLVIMSNWYYRDEIGSNNALAQELVRAGKRVIVVGDTPYEAQCIPQEVQTAVVQFGVTPDSIRTVAEVLFGARAVQAVWPIAYRPPFNGAANSADTVDGDTPS